MKQAEFAKFYDQHVSRVYRFLFFRVNQNVEVAEDLTSEVFMKALKNFESFDPKRSESAWIMTIARNHLINYYRDRKETIDVDEVAFGLAGEDGRAAVVAIDDQAQVRRALAKINAKDRQLIELKYLQGYPYKEIAEIVGKSPGAVRVEAHRAMKKLKQVLDKIYVEPEATTEEAAS